MESEENADPSEFETVTRRDDLEDILERLKQHAHLAIDSSELDVAQHLIAAAETITAGLDKYEADMEPFQESAQYTRRRVGRC
jgi:peptide subunit release factor 1 (eRF1)